MFGVSVMYHKRVIMHEIAHTMGMHHTFAGGGSPHRNPQQSKKGLMDYADMNNPNVWGWNGELQFHSMHDSEACAVVRSISQKQSAGLVPYDERWATDDGAGSGAGTEPGTTGETPVPPSGTTGETAGLSVWTTVGIVAACIAVGALVCVLAYRCYVKYSTPTPKKRPFNKDKRPFNNDPTNRRRRQQQRNPMYVRPRI